MNRSILKKILAALLAAAIAATAVLPVFASASEANSQKEEVVYVNLDHGGSAKEINVVNIFNVEGGKVVDYGKYQNIRNMTTTDEADYSGNTVTIHTSAEKLYYEGKLDSVVMPWDIKIQYYMDGKPYSGEEIAGMSGAMKMKIQIEKNEKCRGNFYESYALQASLSLDTDKCKNIVAGDAAIANVGSDKQLTYTILPGKGADIEITADVTDFELGGISINGIPLNLNIEVDDDELMDQVTELLDAIGKLDDGAGELQDGVSRLQDGAETELKDGVHDLTDGAAKLQDGISALKDGGNSLQSGAAELQNGVNELDEGIHSLNSGIGQMQEALNALNGQSPELVNGSSSFQSALGKLQEALSGVSVTSEDLTALTDASSAIKSGIDDLVSGITALQDNISFSAYKAAMLQNGLDIDGLRQKNESAIGNLQGLINSLSSQIETLKNAGMDTGDLEAQLGSLSDIIALLGAKLVTEYEKPDSGIRAYTDAVAKIVADYSQITEGASKLVSGSGALKTGSDSLYSGTGELLSGIVEIYNGTGSLKDGTGTLDEGVVELISGIAQLYDGAGELKNGTSEMREETDGMDSEITDKIDGLLETVTGGDLEVVSFVSDKNTNIDKVQFVIKTDGIHTEEIEEDNAGEAKTLNMWQKFLNLFGLYDED